MSDDKVLLSSRVILAQVLGRICFAENHAALVCQYKANRREEDVSEACEDEYTEVRDCQREIVEQFEDKEEFINYRDCLEDNHFHFNVCQDEKEKLFQYIQTTDYRYI